MSKQEICESDVNSFLRMSPNENLVAFRVSNSYQIICIDEKRTPIYVNYNGDQLNFESDFFFLNDELIAIPLAKMPFYAIIRVKDGSCLCHINLASN